MCEQRSSAVVARPGRRLQPLPFPRLALVGVTDTNALAARACNAASCGRREDLFGGLAHTGRCNTYVSAHVPDELDQHLAVVTTHYPGLDRADAHRVLWGQVIQLSRSWIWRSMTTSTPVSGRCFALILTCRGGCAAILMMQAPRR